jgi:hypothetical protein
MMRYTNEIREAIERSFPWASIEQDNEGQVVIYTGLYVPIDDFERVSA